MKTSLLTLFVVLCLPATTFAMGRVKHDSSDYLRQISHPTFGSAVILPDNTVWSMALPGKFNNKGPHKDGEVTSSPAENACKEIGGTLPTRQDYLQLMKYFDLININDNSNYGNELCYNGEYTERKYCAFSKEGMQAMHKLFPDMNGDRFWTKSIEFDNWMIADFFDSRAGYLDYDDHTRGAKFAVRCVAK